MTLMKATMSLVHAVGIPKNHPAAPDSLEYTLNPDTLLEHREGSEDSAAVLDEDTATARFEGGKQKALRTESPSNNNDTDSSKQVSSWPFLDILAGGSSKVVETLPTDIAEGLNTGAFGDRPRSAVLIPIPLDFPGKHAGPNLPHAILLVGLNPRCPFDADYESWLHSIVATFSNRLITILQLEVDEELIQERDRLDKAKSRFFMTASHGKLYLIAFQSWLSLLG